LDQAWNLLNTGKEIVVPSARCYSCGEPVSLPRRAMLSSALTYSIGTHIKKDGGWCSGGTLKKGKFRDDNSVEWFSDPLWQPDGQENWVPISQIRYLKRR